MLSKFYLKLLAIVFLGQDINGDVMASDNFESSFEKILNERFNVFDVPPSRANAGVPLMLSPFIESQQLEEARNSSVVDNEHLIEGIRSHAGYITVDEGFNSHLWFWYFPVEGSDESRTPLVVWLQGGPGASSLFGLFEELGPFSVDETGEYVIENPNSWHTKYNLLFIDNPVGTGFSFTDDAGYATNQTRIGEQLYSFMQQFLTIFSDLRNVPLFISGESYAGKHIPALAYQIHINNPTATHKINLQGLAIGNGFIDPASMMDYSSYVYQLGLVSDQVAAKMKGYEGACEAALAVGDYTTAFRFFGATLGTFAESAEATSFYNYIYEKSSSSLYGPFTRFIQKPEVRKALHVGNTKFSSIGKVYRALVGDFMTSAKPWLETLLEHYRTMSYSGQMDIICAYPLSESTYRNLNWTGTSAYVKAPRKPWYSGDVLAGYVRSAGLFQEVMVRNAGHMVPTDQPTRSLELLTSFIENIPLRHTKEDPKHKVL